MLTEQWSCIHCCIVFCWICQICEKLFYCWRIFGLFLSSFWLLWMVLLWTFLSLSEHAYPFLLDRYWGMELLGHAPYMLFNVSVYCLTVFQSGSANIYFHQQSMEVLVVSHTCHGLFLTYDKIWLIWIPLLWNLGWDAYRLNRSLHS